MRADFYHLIRLPLDRVLPAIAERVYARHERLVIVAEDGDLLERLDQLLWTWKPESFLPHARATGKADGDDAQPILLAMPDQKGGDARNIAIVDGRWRDIALDYDRAFLLFDETSIADARRAWRALGDNPSIERHYWKQDDSGKWCEGP